MYMIPSTTMGLDCHAPKTSSCSTHFDSSFVTFAGVISVSGL